MSAETVAICERAKGVNDVPGLNTCVQDVLSTSAEVAKMYCEAISRICRFELEFGRLHPWDDRDVINSIDLVAKAMACHLDIETVQESGAWAMSYLAHVAMLVPQVPWASCVHVLCNAADAHLQSPRIPLRACWALLRIARSARISSENAVVGRAVDMATRARLVHMQNVHVVQYAGQLLQALQQEM